MRIALEVLCCISALCALPINAATSKPLDKLVDYIFTMLFLALAVAVERNNK